MYVSHMDINDCIVCGSDKDLDTEMTITIDGEKISVKVCKEHADDTTPKDAKAAYLKRKSTADAAITAFLAQAAKLGFTVVPQGKMSVMTAQQGTQSTELPTESTKVPPQSVAPISTELQGGRSDGILPSSEVDNIMQNRVAGTSGSVGGTGVEKHAAYNPGDLADKLPDGARDGLVKMELAIGRQGMPLAIPAIRQDGLGTTRVNISNKMNDAELQRRFKQMAANDHSFGQEGYDLHRCSMCQGDGQIAKSKTETVACPKCGGSGLV